jgi:hypothetical protein
MNPITTKDKTEVTLCLNDEESRGERVASNSELHGDHAFSPHWLTSSNPVDSHVGLDQLPSKPPSFLNREYDIKLTIAPPSTSIREIGFPLL